MLFSDRVFPCLSVGLLRVLAAESSICEDGAVRAGGFCGILADY